MPPALLLAAGLGTRLRPLTDRLPKCLVPFVNRPLLDYWRETFERQRVREVIINVHAHPEQVRRHISDRAGGPVRWTPFEEPELFGSAGTLRETLDQLERGPDFLVIYAENLSSIDLRALVRFQRDRGAEFTTALFEAPIRLRVESQRWSPTGASPTSSRSPRTPPPSWQTPESMR